MVTSDQPNKPCSYAAKTRIPNTKGWQSGPEECGELLDLAIGTVQSLKHTLRAAARRDHPRKSYSIHAMLMHSSTGPMALLYPTTADPPGLHPLARYVAAKSPSHAPRDPVECIPIRALIGRGQAGHA